MTTLLTIHILGAIFSWIMTGVLYIKSLSAEGTRLGQFQALIGLATLPAVASGLGLMISQDASVLSFCAKLGLYLSPAVLAVGALAYKRLSTRKAQREPEA